MKKYIELGMVLDKHNYTLCHSPDQKNILVVSSTSNKAVARINMVNDLFAGISWYSNPSYDLRHDLEEVLHKFPRVRFMGLKSMSHVILLSVGITVIALELVLLAMELRILCPQ